MSHDHMMHVINSLDGHASMDHKIHDHAAMVGNKRNAVDLHESHTMHGMGMTFHGGYCETVLFDFWKVTSIGTLLGSMIVIMIMAILYEGLKYYRVNLFRRIYNTLHERSVSESPAKNLVSENNRVVQPSILSWMHSLQTFLHILQITTSYCLMLIFMTYNSWLCFAVVLGTAIGYFIFAWKRSVVVHVTEHCQ